MRHVVTQIPYALTVAACAAVGYFIAGFAAKLGYAVYLPLSLGSFFLLLILALCILPAVFPGAEQKAARTQRRESARGQ